MYLGRLCEIAPSDLLYETPAHHYTAALLASAVEPDPEAPRTVGLLTGEPPSPINPPSGCRFRTRCPRAEARCAEEVPKCGRSVPATRWPATSPSALDRHRRRRVRRPAHRREDRPLLAAASGALFPDLHDDWPLLRRALAENGIEAVTAVWSDRDVDWTAFDLVLASGTWDNIHHVDEFLAWADGVAAAGVPVQNSPATLRWNIDKHYLRDLERARRPDRADRAGSSPIDPRPPPSCPGGRTGGQAVGVGRRLPHARATSPTSRRRHGRTCASSRQRGGPPWSSPTSPGSTPRARRH